MSRSWERFWPLASGVFLGLFAWLLHKSSLHGFWRADDGNHLLFAIEQSPWEYLFHPSVMAAQSYANLTPFNALFYDINLALFGVVPEGHYAHLLGIVAATAIATFFLLRRWLSIPYATLGASLYLLGAPTFYVGQYLMTGHYAAGLLFAVMSLHAYLKGIRDERYSWILWGAVLYGLAALSKEVYVPLVAILPLLGEGGWRRRLGRVLPFLCVVAGYFALRYVVLGGLLGGYSSAATDLSGRAMQIARIPALLFGDSRLGYAGLALVGGLFAWGMAKWQAARLPVLFGGALLLGPLVPLTANPGVTAADRYLYAVWWGMALLLTSLLARLHREHRVVGFVVASVLVVVIGVQHLRYKQALEDGNALNDALYRTALNLDENQLLLPPPEGADYFQAVLNDALAVRRHLAVDQRPPGRVLAKFEDPVPLVIDPRAQLLQYDRDCHCVRDVSERLPDLRRGIEANSRLYRSGEPMSVDFRYRDGRIYWAFDAHQDGEYRVIDLAGRAYGVGPTGSYGWPPHRAFGFYGVFVAKEGWRARTPYLFVDPQVQPEVVWSGGSVSAFDPVKP